MCKRVSPLNCNKKNRAPKRAPEKALGGWWGVFTGRREHNWIRGVKLELISLGAGGEAFIVLAESLTESTRFFDF
jgi:hypothetical protein